MVGAAVESVSGSAWFDSRLFLGVKLLGTRLFREPSGYDWCPLAEGDC